MIRVSFVAVTEGKLDSSCVTTNYNPWDHWSLGDPLAEKDYGDL